MVGDGSVGKVAAVQTSGLMSRLKHPQNQLGLTMHACSPGTRPQRQEDPKACLASCLMEPASSGFMSLSLKKRQGVTESTSSLQCACAHMKAPTAILRENVPMAKAAGGKENPRSGSVP